MTSSELISHVLTFVGGVAVGAFGKYFADHGTDQRRKRETTRQTLAQFQRLQHAMPGLLAEMKKDLVSDSEVRDVAVLPSPNATFHWPHTHFCYYQSDDPELTSKFERLQEAGYVEPKPSDLPVYRMTQEFVDLVVSD